MNDPHHDLLVDLFISYSLNLKMELLFFMIMKLFKFYSSLTDPEDNLPVKANSLNNRHSLLLSLI